VSTFIATLAAVGVGAVLTTSAFAPRWARRAYRNLVYFHEVDKGGHFAAWEEPELFPAELRAAFRSVR
jgi:pimeloyl-ACP methyl ester carboxylesterase